MSNTAHYVALARFLGLTADDLAELSGLDRESVNDIACGQQAWPSDLRDAVDAIHDESFALTDMIIAEAVTAPHVIWIFQSNEDFRRHFPNWPGHGQAAGGFVGPHSIAAIYAQAQLAADGIDLDMRLYG